MSAPSPEAEGSFLRAFMNQIVAFNGVYCTRETALRITHEREHGDYDAMLHVGYIDAEANVHPDDVSGLTETYQKVAAEGCWDEPSPSNTIQ